MPGRFEEALAQNPVPKRLGDVTLRYEPSLLVGEAARPGRGRIFTLVILAGSALAIATLGALIARAALVTVCGTGLLTAAAFAAATVLDQRARRRRCFVLNFQSTTLRLDFSTPFANRARTLVIHFDRVRDCSLCTQGDGLIALTVDFAPSDDQLLREVLVANISLREEDAAQRLHRMLKGAFGLGAAPENSLHA
jgi:hypothetical protein